MQPKISIVVPCFNQGAYLAEVLSSLEACDGSLYELILVNDGSTDDNTNKIMEELSRKGHHVIFQENKGLGGARNAGIAAAKGTYILPLDADNKIRPAYLEKSIAILDNDPSVAVVYGDAMYFGEKQGHWKVGGFNMQRLMLGNYIDACAVIRRSVLVDLGGYDTSMRLGWEDWDVWLRIAFAGHAFHYVEEILFDYRVLNTSMARTLYNNYAKPNSIENYVEAKYASRMGQEWIVRHFIKRFKQTPVLFIAKLIIRAYFPKYYNKLLTKNKVRNGL